MADTSQVEPLAQTNGFADDGLDEGDREKIRPADIDADVREMERRKRVEMIMNSRLFREELERIFDSQMKDGGAGPGGLLQQLSDMMGHGGPRSNVFRSSNCVIPINDIRGLEAMGYSKGEKLLRCKLASVYRLMDLYGWTQGIHNHITARLNQDEEHFLVNPWGMLYHEITASSLVKVDMQGNIVEKGTTNFGVNKDSFHLHSAIHAARPDIKCIIHIHTSSVLAISSLKCGLLPICQESLVIGEVSSHQYQGGLFEPEERDKISRNLGPNNKVMFLTNHGAMCCGETVEEAFFNVYNTVQACESQIKLMPMGVENLVLLTDETRKRVFDAARRPPDGFVLDKSDKEKDKEVTSPTIAAKGKRWCVGCTEFEALMRMLDNAGFRTGYIYRHPLVKGDPPRPRNDVEVPPAVSSLGYLLEEEEMYRQGGWKKWMEGRKTHDRTRWLNSPNVYQKVEILETGTPDPKKITKWVADGSPTHSSTPVKIDTLQFVPKNTNPKEFKRLQQQIKENRRADKITSGPQSHILEGVSWEEAKKMQDANISQTGDQVILVGAASKGIIQRGFQHNAMVYKAPYAKNPFDTVTDDELEEYKKTVQRKARGDGYDEDQSESEALSSAAGRPPTGKSPTSPISDDESRDDSDYPDAHVERSKSARFPQKDCSGKKLVNGFVRCPLQKPVDVLPRPPHFHHAAYTNLPRCQSTRTVSCRSPCSITRFSKVNATSVDAVQALTDFVSSSITPQCQVPPGDVRTEFVEDDDEDSLADISSLPSSDADCLDENHNLTGDAIEVVKVQLMSIGELQSTLITSSQKEDVTIPQRVNGVEIEAVFSDDSDSGSHLPLETCDETVIQTTNSNCQSSLSQASSILDRNSFVEAVEQTSLSGDLTVKLQTCSDDATENSQNFDLGHHKSNLCPQSLESSCKSVSLTEVAAHFSDSSNFVPHVPVDHFHSVGCLEIVQKEAMDFALSSEKQPGIDTAHDDTLSFDGLDAKPYSVSTDVTVDEVCQDNTSVKDDHSESVEDVDSQYDAVDHQFEQSHAMEISTGTSRIPDENKCLSEDALSKDRSSAFESDIVLNLDECSAPCLESLGSECKTRLYIKDNEEIDLYSVLSVDPSPKSEENSFLVEDVVATRQQAPDQDMHCEDNTDFNNESLTDSDCEETYHFSNHSLFNQEDLSMTCSSSSPELEKSGEREIEVNTVDGTDFPDFQNISRTNFEMAEAMSPANFCQLQAQESTSFCSSMKSSLLNSFYEDDSDPNILYGAGEILYDSNEVCSEVYGSPLSTFSNVDFSSDAGEEYYSPDQSVEPTVMELDYIGVSDDEKEIEIDCDLFSQHSVTSDSSGRVNDLCHMDSERWPAFVSFSLQPELELESEDVADNHDSKSESQDDLVTICGDDFNLEPERMSTSSGDDLNLQLEPTSARIRKDHLARFSVSLPNMESLGTTRSSPLELGRFFTLRNCFPSFRSCDFLKQSFD